MLCRPLQRMTNPFQMIIRIRFEIRIPGNLLRKNNLPVDDRRRLAIRPSQIKTNPAAIEVTPQRIRLRLGLGKRIRRFMVMKTQRLTAQFRPHKIRIKMPFACRRIQRGKKAHQISIPMKVHPGAAFQPKQGLQSPTEILFILSPHCSLVRKKRQGMVKARSIFPPQG